MNNPAETVVSAVVPVALALADNDKSKEKKILNNSPRQANASKPVTTKPATTSTSTSGTTANTGAVDSHARDYADPDMLSGEDAFLSMMGDQAVNPGELWRWCRNCTL